jgi:ABC-2 type transport system permease protein
MTRQPIRALARRDLRRYFENPTGYVFITLFIFLSGAAAFWHPRFFADNLATLDQLNARFPYVLVLFVPALTMGVWADERKQGTDELLLTLPATDTEIVFGKYLAVLGVYTISVALSLSHVAVLSWLGSPDAGLLAANYLGYWLAGASLITVGMLGSLLAGNQTIAFVVAVVLCAVPVMIDRGVAIFSEALGRRVAVLGVFDRFADFASGVISLSGVGYFAALAALCLYLNIVVLGRRHWVRRGTGLSIGGHHAVRGVAVAVALAAAVVLLTRGERRLDVTAERLHSMGDETRALIDGLPDDRPITMRVFASPIVPTEYVQQRENLLSAVREVQARAGATIDVIVEDTESYSVAARTARERFGIVPRLVAEDATAAGPSSVYLGVVVTSGPDEHVIPFLERELSAEYELARAIRLVTRTTRKRVGIIDSDARITGGVDYEAGRPRAPWAIASELSQQYEIVPITPSEPIEGTFDALLVVLPSMLLQREIDHVFAAVQRGVPAVILLDPVPGMDMRLAPAAAMAARQDPYAQRNQAVVRKNTGDVQAGLAAIGVGWQPARVVSDSYRPNADLAQMPSQVVFAGRGSGNATALSTTHGATAGLRELMFMYPGALTEAESADVTFDPIVSTSPLGGTVGYFQLVQPTPNGPVLNVNVPAPADHQVLTLAAHVRSSSRPLNAIVIADLDFVSNQFFALRQSLAGALQFDNIDFLLNCLDILAGDDSFVKLRTRRVRHRTLERVEAQTRTFIEQRNRDERQAAADAQAAIDAARGGVQKMVDATEARTDLDAQSRQIVMRNVVETENRRLDALRSNIERARDAKIQDSRETLQAEVRRIHGTIRTAAVTLPPLPVLLLGLVMFVRRRRRERDSAAAARRLRDGHD